MKTLKAALVAAMLLPASGAVADNMETMQMRVGLSMLESNAQGALTRYDLKANVQDLSLSQLAQIVSILDDPNGDSAGASRKASIEAVLRRK
jgi:hypothetical protein